MVFMIDQAKVPLLNLYYKDSLWVDLSFSIVSQINYDEDPMTFVESLVPVDQNSLTSLTSVKTSIIIKEIGGEQLSKMLRIVKKWAINR
jgi:hypothetical protein